MPTLNIRASKYMKTERMKKEIDKFTIICGNFNPPPLEIDRTNWHKSVNMQDLNKAVNQPDIIEWFWNYTLMMGFWNLLTHQPDVNEVLITSVGIDGPWHAVTE